MNLLTQGATDTTYQLVSLVSTNQQHFGAPNDFSSPRPASNCAQSRSLASFTPSPFFSWANVAFFIDIIPAVEVPTTFEAFIVTINIRMEKIFAYMQ